MKKLKEFLISFSGLIQGKHTYSLRAEDTFFTCFEYSEITHANVEVEVLLHKHSTFLELTINIKGKIEVMCDRCTDNFFETIKGERNVVVKFGDEFLDEGDDLIILPHSENEIDLSSLVYESIVLSVPPRRIHPEGECNQDILDALENIRVEETNEDKEIESDPRWDALKKLK